ncbi:MAG: thioredoxin domain-containing protein [Acidobacteriota bacterium]|nr:thioredoxin domain-containing protein [Acidobacteriota bacterium]
MSNQEHDTLKHTNRLIHENSPYLLQHAHNPVDWHPWGEEAITKAKAENKPILLSVGYSACHWCHEMEKESFENEDIARLMNENFVNIKVDREERPDVDQIYMSAVQMMTRHGGWPLTVFLTPDLVPFFGGTYFPPEDRHGMPGFPRVLAGVADAYRERPDDVEQTAQEMLIELRHMGVTSASNEMLETSLLDDAFRRVARGYDSRYGGFGSAPKFPSSMSLEFSLRTFNRTGRTDAIEMVKHTCRRMAEGGLYDQLGGGFHRYSTDARWLVPHFEKMLYDNALLSRLYLHVYQVTGDSFFRRVAEETFDYVIREMTDESGGFYSTQDADSEGVEGKFFVWKIEEIKTLLGEEDAPLFCAYYDVTPEGNFEEHNILNVRPAEQVAEEAGVSVARLMEAIERGRETLFSEREKRVKPGRDEKILTAWNGMMLESFAEASVVLDRADYREIAERNGRFILDHLRRDGLLLHTYKDGVAKYYAYLDDYAQAASALVTLYETTGSIEWLEEALRLAELMIKEFWDEEDGGFFFTGASGEQLIVRTKDFTDNATPSGNSVAAELLLRLALLTERDDLRRKAITVLRLVREQVERYPSAFGYLLGALDFYLSTPKEIVLIGESEAADTRALAREVWQRFMPNKVVAQAARADEQLSHIVPLLRDRIALEGRATAYVCENYSCRQPATTPEELAAQLDDSAARNADGEMINRPGVE